jgi:hypothetical protein
MGKQETNRVESTTRDDLRVIITFKDLRMTKWVYGQYLSNLVIRLSSNQV